MTQNQIDLIVQMKRVGAGARKIAKSTGIPYETVKSYFRRHHDWDTDQNCCRYCGKPIESKPKCKPRKFCSDRCRLSWWKDHPEQLNRKAFYPNPCPCRGQSFLAYGRPNHKYCSKKCSDESKRKKPTMDVSAYPHDTQWQKLSYEEKNHQLYLSQKALLAMFLEHGAISQAQHEKSLHDLREKMGEYE